MSTYACPYCEHPNPDDAKFCNACGAALNLVPCRKCGAVNKVTASSCYRCQTPLRTIFAKPAGDAAGASPPVGEPAILESTVTAVVLAESPARMSAAAIQPRSSATLLGLLLLAVLAAAGYYTYRRATPALTPSVATEQASGTVVPAVIGPGNSGSGVITLAAPAATAAQTPANSAATAPVIDASAANPAPAQRDAVSVQPPADAGIAPRTPRIRVPRASSVAADPAVKPAPCTEAVAALGLCKL